MPFHRNHLLRTYTYTIPQSETLNSCELMTTEIQGLYYLLQLSLLLLQVQILQLKQKIVTSQKKLWHCLQVLCQID